MRKIAVTPGNNQLKGKKLVKTYRENGFTVKVYEPVLSAGECKHRDIRIKNEIIGFLNSTKNKDKKQP